MARKRSRRRARRHNPLTRHRRRRRNPIGALGLNPRRRRRWHNPRRSHRRRRHNPFGLGKGRGLLAAMPSMPVLLGAVAGGVGTPMILSKFGLLAKLPGVTNKTTKTTNVMVASLYTAGIGVVLGGLLAKFAGKKFGYSFAMGAAVVPLAGLAMAKVSGVSGLGFDGGDYDISGGDYDISGGDYGVSGAIPELEGMGAIDELEGLGEEVPELEGAF